MPLASGQDEAAADPRSRVETLATRLRAQAGADAEAAWRGGLATLVARTGGSSLVATSLVDAAQACLDAGRADAAVALAAHVPGLLDRAGRRAAVAALGEIPRLLPRLAAPGDVARVLGTLERLAKRAPAAVEPLVRTSPLLLARLDAEAYDAFVETGVAHAGGDGRRLLAFVDLASREGRAALEAEAGERPLAERAPGLSRFVAALFDIHPLVRPASVEGDPRAARRTRFDGRLVLLPESFRGYRGSAAERLERAALAHVGAHLTYGRGRLDPGTLKPVQIAIVSLMEDARVERLAMAALPGLARLWLPFHDARAEGAQTAESQLARLSRALVDPDYRDDGPWVAKGRTLFEAALADPDPAALRRLAGLLGNDLGQMRVRFDAKAYVPQPVYRDDNSGLWLFEPDAPPPADAPEIAAQGVRIETTETPPTPPDRERRERGADAPPAPARPRDAGEESRPVLRLPEWDYHAARLRPDWVSVLDERPRTAPAHLVDRWIEARPATLLRTEALVRQARVGRPKRLRRQAEGERLDLDAAIGAVLDQRLGLAPDPRVFETVRIAERDIALVLLLDVSESTKDTIGGTTTSVFSVVRDATAVLARVLDALGDPFAVHAFASNGRENVHYTRVKDFHEPFEAPAKSRLAGLRPGYSTRMGAALRMATRALAGLRAHRRLVLLVTDGEPSDVDCPDPRHLVEDARKAVQEAAALGVDAFCVAVAPRDEAALATVFGRANVAHLPRVEALPDRLPQVYCRLVR
ncbi:nitric oxide reductase activation protein NorD [Salinarimonas sp. NSM]|uniref:nitric oxide reductase activation protein NorD n=1 Tax=Salinarimonas sp. NSM TaxID=3458003 RepID=UPI0040353677